MNYKQALGIVCQNQQVVADARSVSKASIHSKCVKYEDSH